MGFIWAYAKECSYRWPDDKIDDWKSGVIIVTNANQSDYEEYWKLTSLLTGYDDDDVLIYIDNEDTEQIKQEFDGLIVQWV